MEYSASTKKVIDFVTKACKRKKTRNSATPTQVIPLDEQTKNDFELRHDTKLKDTMIYLDPDYNFRLTPALLAFAVENKIHIRKSKYNPGTSETDAILEHELTHVQQHSENRANESVDELELEANFNEGLSLHNGEEVRYVEYAPGKYWKTTETEYNMLLNQVAAEFERETEGKLRSMTNAEQLRFLLTLRDWARDPFDEPFSLRGW
ncbi:MAG: DUF4157 domain-containing protein [Treponema sp.]|uniref:eCIS core domain-containing protein n=1 Tax=Treponema sp. TaxID=166 RepID=UPI0025D9415B|nr:DUF4157 domain-containing protein [Treponema sp.]MBQ8678988.1 DUF4157 domain-containing protein [Treponema sp.]